MPGRIIFVTTALVLISALSFADHSHENQKASQAYNSGGYATAFNIWLGEAESGETMAQSTIGAMYAHGKGTTQNYSEAARWYLMAAEQGNLNSQLSLAHFYRQGLGVPQNNALAYACWSIASAKGNQLAQREVMKLQAEMSSSQRSQAQEVARDLWAKIGWSKRPLEFSLSAN